MSQAAGTNGNGTLAMMAGWPPWMRFAAFVGVPSVIALFLVWRLDGRSSTDIAAIATELRSHAAVTSATSSSFQSFSQEQRLEGQTLLSLLRAICVNTARTDQQRRECVR